MSGTSGTFDEFKRFTIDVARGTRTVGPADPKVWVERVDADDNTTMQFRSLEAGVKLLSPRNRERL